MTAQRWRITGRVQNVGFRAFVYRTALQMQVFGAVWNTNDGAVELIAKHDDTPVLEQFVGMLTNGPGRVDAVTFCGEELMDFRNFQVVTQAPVA